MGHEGTRLGLTRSSQPLSALPCPLLELSGNRHGLPSEDYSGPGNIAMKTSAS